MRARALPSLLLLVPLLGDTLAATKSVSFEEWSGLTQSTVALRNKLYTVSDTLPLLSDGSIVMVSVGIISTARLEGRTFQFVGDAERFNNLGNELRFIESFTKWNRVSAGADGAVDFGKSLWDGLQTLSVDPITPYRMPHWFTLLLPADQPPDSNELHLDAYHEIIAVATGGPSRLKQIASATRSYIQSLEQGQADLTEDLRSVVAAYWEAKLDEVANSHNIEYASACLPETEVLIERLAWDRFGTQAACEIATVVLPYLKTAKAANAAKAAKAASAAKATKAMDAIGDTARTAGKAADSGRVGRAAVDLMVDARKVDALLSSGAFGPRGSAIVASRARVARFDAVAAGHMRTASAQAGIRIDPLRLGRLTSKRAANVRINQTMLCMYDAERAGTSPSRFIDDALESCGANRRIGEFYHDPTLAKEALVENYRVLKQGGVFEDSINLEKLRRGRSPTIKRGPYSGETMEVDHIIPVAVDDSLSANLANLKYSPMSANRAKGMQVTDEAVALARQLEEAVGYPPQAVLEAATAGVP